MDQTSTRFRFIDLFAGLGGFHVALSELGGEAVFAAEWEPALNSLYMRNFGITPWSDVNDLDSDERIATEIPDHEVLTAGFPCQPFSKAGEQLGFEHTLQGQLFFKVFEILKIKRPRLFILENVPNILKHNNGDTLRTITTKLQDELGYTVTVKRLSPHQFEVPQIRERAYFIGSLDGLDDFTLPEPTYTKTDISSVLQGKDVRVRAIPEQTFRAIDMWDDFLKSSGTVKLPSFPIWSMEFGATYPYMDATPPALWKEQKSRGLDAYQGIFGFPLEGLTIEEQFGSLPSHSRRAGDYRFPTWKQSFIRQNREFFAANNDWIIPWMNKWEPWKLPSSLQKFEWNAQGEDRRIDKFVIQVRASGIRVKRTSTAPSLIAMTHSQVPILGSEITGVRRYMSPRECAALQSLGNILLPESDLQAYKALGNAVNARVVKKIAQPLLAHFLTDSSKSSREIAA